MTELRTRTKYTYDGASQLSGIAYQNGSTALGNLTYSYDLLGRRASVGGSFARTGLPLAVNQTAYNANNQLTTWGTANLFYDLDGNMTSDGTHSYTWDARNRLKQIDLGNTASFTYDAFGRRTTKNIIGTSTTFLYDRLNPVQEVIGGTNTANSLSGGVDEIFQRTDSAGARSFLSDQLGSTLALTDSTGTVQSSYTFEPFGNTTLSGSATTNSFAYTGRELDASNLYYYRARYYNPFLQRFISEDPVGFRGGINLYRYVKDNPINLKDPFGLATIFLGGNVNWQFGPFNIQYTGGLAIDTDGNIAAINTAGGGAAVGTGINASLGLNLSVSNAPNVCGLGGPFVGVGGNGGLGANAGLNGFTGVYKGKPVVGLGVTAGAGLGAGLSDDITDTVVTPEDVRVLVDCSDSRCSAL